MLYCIYEHIDTFTKLFLQATLEEIGAKLPLTATTSRRKKRRQARRAFTMRAWGRTAIRTRALEGVSAQHVRVQRDVEPRAWISGRRYGEISFIRVWTRVLFRRRN